LKLDSSAYTGVSYTHEAYVFVSMTAIFPLVIVVSVAPVQTKLEDSSLL